MKNTVALVLVIILITVLLSGCRNNSDNDIAGHTDNFYTADIIPFPEIPADFENISNITVTGNIVYFTASNRILFDSEVVESFRSDAIFAMTNEGTNLRKLPDYSIEAPPSAATGGGLYIDAMYADRQGDLWVVEVGRYYISEEPDITRDAGSTLTIRKLNSNGVQLLSADISDFPASFDGFYVSMFIIDDEGYIYIGCDSFFSDETTFYVLDPNCELLFELKATTHHNPFISTIDGSVAFVRQQRNERFLQKIDAAGKTWGDIIHLPENAMKVFSGSNDFLVTYTDNASFYGISGESGETVKILNWVDTGVVPEGLEIIALLDRERIFLIRSTISRESGNQINELILMTKTEAVNTEVTEKTELTLGTLSLNPQLQGPILQFNNTSKTHYISVIDYSSNTTPDDTDGALLRFVTEITTGKVPDILILTQMPFDRLIALDLLVDLNPYLDADPELSRDNLMESVLKATETDGKLYMINQTFTISSIVGNPSVLGEYPGWTVDEFKAVIDANPQADIPFGPHATKQDFLWQLLYMNLYEYIDMTSGTANFNNEGFIELLKLIDTFPSEVDDTHIMDRLFNIELKDAGRQIMDTFIGGNLHNHKLQKESFGGEIVFKGWPSADRNGSRFISHDGVAITTRAADKESAWEFVRILLMEEHQRNYFNHFPINRTVFEERIERDMEPMGFMHNGKIINVEPTQEDADEIIALINSITKISGHGSDEVLRNIIIETATDFFNGMISAEDAARIIQNRASNFIAEQSG